MKYKHTQTGYLILSVLIAVVLFYMWLYGVIEQNDASNDFATAVMFFIIFILASVSTLRVSIDDSHLRVKFGYGLFKKKFALSEITSAKAVKNHWYYGWGIRVWFWPYMWIYNISGFDAVEIKTKSGRIYRTGTDEPGKLEEAIKNNIKTQE